MMVRKRFVVATGAALLLASGPAGAQHKLARNMAPALVTDVGEWFNADSYPPDAVRAARQGRVVAAVGVDSAGEVVSCTIESSSGTASLDAATCRIASEHLHFNPATDRKGRPTASVFHLPVRWMLPEDDPESSSALPAPIDLSAADGRESQTEIQISFDADGKVVSCKPLTINAMYPSADPCERVTLGAQYPMRWVRDGHPVGAVVVQRVYEHVIAAP